MATATLRSHTATSPTTGIGPIRRIRPPAPVIPAQLGPSRAKSGCWTCRIRRKKCDEQRVDGSCQTCVRLKLKCLGWGTKRPEWMKDKDQVEAFKSQIKLQLATQGMIRGQPRSQQPPPATTTTTTTSATTEPAPASPDTAPVVPSSYVPTPIISIAPPGMFPNDGSGPFSDEDEAEDLFGNFPVPVPDELLTAGPLVAAEASAVSLDASPYQSYDSTLSAFASLTSGNSYESTFFGPPPPSFIPQITDTTDVMTSNALTNTSFTAFGQVFPYEPRIRTLTPPPPNGNSPNATAHVLYYFNHVRHMQYVFGGQFVTNVLHDIVVKEPRGVVTNAICALAAVHETLMRSASGLEAEDLRSPHSSSSRFFDRAFAQLFTSKQQHGRYTEADATAALHFVSFWLFSGGHGDWQTALSIAGDWYAQTQVATDENPVLAMLGMSNTGKFAAQRIIWFDVLSSITLLRPPRFLKVYQRLFSGGAGYWAAAAGVQMDQVMGCSDEVLLAIAETAELAHWKDEQIKERRLSMAELARRGLKIENTLRRGPGYAGATLQEVDAQAAAAVPPLSSEESSATLSDEEVRKKTSQVFRDAALLYLHTVMSGCNPNVPEIEAAVNATRKSLEALPPSDVDRSLVFPICLGGCMSDDPSSRVFFKSRFVNIDKSVGNLSQALYLMEMVWERRDSAGGAETCWREVMHELGINLLLV